MASQLHETILELFTRNPPLAADLASDVFDTELPAWHDAEVQNAQFNDQLLAELRADTMIALTDADGQMVASVVVEVQTSPNPDKQYVWPAYLANLWHRHRVPAMVLVSCPTETLASQFRDPIKFGPGSVVHPLVVGPEQIPVIADPAQATANPELAVLSAMAHGNDNHQVLEASVTGVRSLDDEPRTMYYDLIYAGLDTVARKFMEDYMATTTEPLSDVFREHWQQGIEQGREQGIEQGIEQGREQGREQGLHQAVLSILAARDVEVPNNARTRITECSDLDQLETWVRRAATADSVHHLFND